MPTRTRVPWSTRSPVGWGFQRAALPAPDAPGSALSPLPTRLLHQGTAREPLTLCAGTGPGPAHAPAAQPWGVSAHAQSPQRPRPAALGVGSPRRVLGGGGAACAHAQKAGAQRGELRAVRSGAVVEVGTLRVWRAGGVAACHWGREASMTGGPGRRLSPRWGRAEGGGVGAGLRGRSPRRGSGPSAVLRSPLPACPPCLPRTECRAGRNAGPEPAWILPHTHLSGGAGAPD